jgi:hypothetical protein
LAEIKRRVSGRRAQHVAVACSRAHAVDKHVNEARAATGVVRVFIVVVNAQRGDATRRPAEIELEPLARAREWLARGGG